MLAGVKERTDWVRAHPVTTFYLLAFGISWLGFLPLLAASAGMALFQNPLWKLSLILPGCGPALAVAATLRLAGERGSPISRLRAALRWRVSAVWYALAVLVPAALLLAAQGISRLLPLGPAPASPPASTSALVALALISVAANPWEEVGWRAFALTKLQVRRSPLVAATLVGTLSGLWHIPLFLLPESGMSTFPFALWFVEIVGKACILAWLYNSAGESLAIAMLFHIASNLFSAIIGIQSFLILALVNLGVVFCLLWRGGIVLGLARPQES